MFCISLFVLFLLAIVLSVLLRYTDSGYPFGRFSNSSYSSCVKASKSLDSYGRPKMFIGSSTAPKF